MIIPIKALKWLCGNLVQLSGMSFFAVNRQGHVVNEGDTRSSSSLICHWSGREQQKDRMDR